VLAANLAPVSLCPRRSVQWRRAVFSVNWELEFPYIARYWLLASRFRSDDDRRRRPVAFLSVYCTYVNVAVDTLI
jgi:hypothetical protein